MKIDPAQVRFRDPEPSQPAPQGDVLNPAHAPRWRPAVIALLKRYGVGVGLALAALLAAALSEKPEENVPVVGMLLVPVAAWMAYGYYWRKRYESRQAEMEAGVRGRTMSTAEKAWEHFERVRPAGDPGVLWGTSRIASSEARGHFAVVGSVGSGKTLTLRMLMKDQLRYLTPGSDRRALIYDAKQDMMQIVGSLPDLKCPHILLNPFDQRGYAWDIAKDVDSPLTARELAMVLVPDENESQKFFSSATRELLTKVVCVFIKQRPGAWTFRELLLVMRSRELLREVLESDEECRDAASNFLNTGTTTLGSIMATIATKLGPYEAIAAAWEQAGDKRISIAKWLRTEQIIILGNDERTRSTLDAINQLFVSLVAKHALTMTESKTRMTWFFFDEFREAGRLRGLESLILRGRSKGCCVVLGFQDIQGVQEVYGERLGNELVGQCGCKAFLHIESPQTAEWASKCIGDVERKVSSTSQSSSAQGSSTSETISQQIVPRIMPSQFQMLPIPDLEQGNGLEGFYLVRSFGFYPATYEKRQLDQLLGSLNELIEPFVEAPVTWQYLPPWSAADAAEILGARGKNPNGSLRTIVAPAKMSTLRLPAAQKITLE